MERFHQVHRTRTYLESRICATREKSMSICRKTKACYIIPCFMSFLQKDVRSASPSRLDIPHLYSQKYNKNYCSTSPIKYGSMHCMLGSACLGRVDRTVTIHAWKAKGDYKSKERNTSTRNPSWIGLCNLHHCEKNSMCQHNMLISEGTYSLTCTEPFARPPATHLPSRPHAQAVTDTRPGLANFGFITYRQVQIISIFLLVSDHQHHPVHLLSSLKHQITIQCTRP